VVAVMGRPNVGKSTLVNRIVGEKISIVSPVPQTTRNRLRGVCNLPEGQIVLLDTPGIHRPHHRMNRRMVESALASASEVDLIHLVAEAEGLGPGDRFVLRTLRPDGPPVILVLNKADRVRRPLLLPVLEEAARAFPFAELIPLSAQSGENVDRLLRETVRRLPVGPPLFPAEILTDQHERFLVGELVREKICLSTRQEVPHEAAVLVDLWDASDGRLLIEASIVVEKENQKAIVIGREGSRLKQIGTDARLEIERVLGRPVVLKLWVIVRKGWREDPGILDRLGLG
jgi:GTP-binding protein Era